MPRWRPPLFLSLAPSLSSISIHQCAPPEHRTNPWIWIYPPCPFINTAQITPAILGCQKRSGLQQNTPFVLPLHSLFFQKTLHHSSHSFFFLAPHLIHFGLLFQTVLVHSLPVACIFRLPKWFARLKSLRTNTMLYPGAKKSRWCGALLRPARLWIPPRRRMRGEMRFSSASLSAGIMRRCGASFTRVLWKGYPILRSEGSGSSPGLSFYTLFWQVSSFFSSALHPQRYFNYKKKKIPAEGVKAVAASLRQHVTKGMAGAHGARVSWDGGAANGATTSRVNGWTSECVSEWVNEWMN